MRRSVAGMIGHAARQVEGIIADIVRPGLCTRICARMTHYSTARVQGREMRVVHVRTLATKNDHFRR